MSTSDEGFEKPYLLPEELDAISTVRGALGRIARLYPTTRHMDLAMFGQLLHDLQLLEHQFPAPIEPGSQQ